jgi:hypothetical protein
MRAEFPVLNPMVDGCSPKMKPIDFSEVPREVRADADDTTPPTLPTSHVSLPHNSNE